MAWTYSGDPTASDRDAVRFEIGDTNTNDQQLTDAEIDYALAQRGSVIQAAIYCAERLISLYSRYVAQSVGAVNVQYNQRIDHYKGLIARLRLRGGKVTPFIGGQSLAGKIAADEDSDRNAPKFKRGMLDRTN